MPGTLRAVNIGRIRGLQLIRSFGAEVRQARLSAGLSQQQVGAAVGVSHTQISRIELAQLQTLGFALAARLAAVWVSSSRWRFDQRARRCAIVPISRSSRD